MSSNFAYHSDCFDLTIWQKKNQKQIKKSQCMWELTPWGNGSASDSRSKGCVFKSRRGQHSNLFSSKAVKWQSNEANLVLRRCDSEALFTPMRFRLKSIHFYAFWPCDHTKRAELWSQWHWEQVNCGLICSRERDEWEWCIFFTQLHKY